MNLLKVSANKVSLRSLEKAELRSLVININKAKSINDFPGVVHKKAFRNRPFRALLTLMRSKKGRSHRRVIFCLVF